MCRYYNTLKVRFYFALEWKHLYRNYRHFKIPKKKERKNKFYVTLLYEACAPHSPSASDCVNKLRSFVPTIFFFWTLCSNKIIYFFCSFVTWYLNIFFLFRIKQFMKNCENKKKYINGPMLSVCRTLYSTTLPAQVGKN